MGSRIHNHRYYRNESTFFRVFNALVAEQFSFTIRPIDICRRANFSKSTFYRHFSSVADLYQRQRENLLHDFRLYIKATIEPGSETTKIFSNLCIFILRHRDFFNAACLCDGLHFPDCILWELQPQLTTNWRSFTPTTDLNFFASYIANLRPVLTHWQTQNFDQKYLGSTIRDLNTITEFFITHRTEIYQKLCHQADIPQPQKMSPQ